MKIGRSYWALAAMVWLTGGQAFAEGRSMMESVEVSNHHIFNSDIEVNGATILIRDVNNDVIRATVMTGALEPDWAYSIWWVVFNRPRFCVVRNACTGADLEVNGGDPRVKASVFWAGGLLADGTGSASTELTLVPGKTDRELFAQSKNFGLRNLRKAEIHLVIRSHGLAGIAGPVATQVGTANQACPDTGCVNEFASVHKSTL